MHNAQNLNRRSTLIIAIAIAIAALVPHTAPAAASTERRPSPSLGAMNILSGNEAGWIDVRLRRQATLSIPEFNQRVVQVSGKGRVVGFVLSQQPVNLADSATLVVARFPSYKASAREVLSIGINISDENGKYTLPPGDYRLYLLGDGKPVRVRFKLSGLKGTQRFIPQRRARLTLKNPSSDLYGGSVNNVYTAGAEKRLRDKGLLFQHLWARTEAHAASLTSFCSSHGAPKPTDHPAPYGPGCPNGNTSFSGHNPATYVETSPSLIQHYGGGVAASGIWGLGFSRESASIQDLGYTAIWLELE